MPTVNIRLYSFLARIAKAKEFSLTFDVMPTVKHLVEHLGIPHTEVDLIVADGNLVPWTYIPQDGERISFYPLWHTLPVPHLQKPPPEIRFVVDVNLGKLAKLLRILGFDTLYQNTFSDEEILAIGTQQNRIILTRDKLLLCHHKILYGHWVMAEHPYDQANEVIERYNLYDIIQPLSRCLICNTLLLPIAKSEIEQHLPPRVKTWCEEFFFCPTCDRIYWKGSHYEHMMQWIQNLKKEKNKA
ncbi:Mut7-C RNAse domain-containing protein [Thermospira aquatica]|uniref:Twitching motility protein PilT n=1 Tax=Thermospira aquatica TaxID=2828656 RepID=A0AAX3BDU0_9SPIR|nr:Mut7-C RNAse domain-containing protein [Thermospira aquatica]URA10406.1 hypothetical protein KDW03_00965 [Thermospira aquatica]